MIVFGGFDGIYRNDVWALSLSSPETWTQLSPSGPLPPARYVHTAVYDAARDRLIVFGGSGGTYLNDVWALTFADLTWHAIVTGGAPPSPRVQMTAVLDAAHDRMVLFGGYDGSANLQDCWSLSLADPPRWTQVPPSGTPPSARRDYAAVADMRRGRMVLFGGFDTAVRNDVWTLSLSDTSTWSHLVPIGGTSAARYTAVATLDASGDQMLLYGGAGSLYKGAATPFLNDARALALGGAPAWSVVKPQRLTPPGLYYESATYDSKRRRMLVFAGLANIPQNAVWSLSLDGEPTWSQVTPSNCTLWPRMWSSAVFDPYRDRMIVFGGASELDIYDEWFLNDVWELRFSPTLQWNQLFPSGPAPVERYAHTAVFDPVHDRMIVFGGFTYYQTLNDTWELSLDGDPVWRQLLPSRIRPSARGHHTAVYDSQRQRMVICNGANSYVIINDTDALSLAGSPVWSEIPAGANYPDPRADFVAIYDSLLDRMVIDGGQNQRRSHLTDTWALPFAGQPVWMQLHPTGLIPHPRRSHVAVNDVPAHRMVTFGGSGFTDTDALTWDMSTAVSPPPADAPVGSHGATIHHVSSRSTTIDVRFELVRGERTTIDVLDVAGHLVLHHVASNLGGGGHMTRLVPPRPLAAGVYFFRLRDRIDEGEARVVVIP
jgi:hypothetical protein